MLLDEPIALDGVHLCSRGAQSGLRPWPRAVEARSQRKGCGAGKHLDPTALRSRGERSLEELELLRAQLTVTRRQCGGAPVEGASTPASVHLRLGTVTQGRRLTALETGFAPG